MCSNEKTSKIKISASQLISKMICMHYDNNKKFELLQFHSGYGKNYLNGPTGYSRTLTNAQIELNIQNIKKRVHDISRVGG